MRALTAIVALVTAGGGLTFLPVGGGDVAAPEAAETVFATTVGLAQTCTEAGWPPFAMVTALFA